MQLKKGAGGNDLAKIMASINLAAKQEAGERTETLGLGKAKAQEEERWKWADKRKAAQKIEQQQREQRAITTPVATTRTAEQLYG